MATLLRTVFKNRSDFRNFIYVHMLMHGMVFVFWCLLYIMHHLLCISVCACVCVHQLSYIIVHYSYIEKLISTVHACVKSDIQSVYDLNQLQ